MKYNIIETQVPNPLKIETPNSPRLTNGAGPEANHQETFDL